MDQIEPLISSTTAGPIGIAHLPRLWLKVLLHSVGRLPEGYRAGEGGFDGSLFERFGIDGPSFVRFVEETHPDYLTTEQWVEDHAQNLRPSTIQRWNTYVRSANLTAERASDWRKRFNIADDAFAHGTSLNDLDDWHGIHARIATKRGEPAENP